MRPYDQLLLALGLVCAAAGATAQNLPDPGIGPAPVLPAPEKTLIPTVHIAPARGWPRGSTPVPAASLAVSAYAAELDHPRWLY
ncbi:MAG: sorbosone dehydrogenase family protein, partial [Pseudomonadota bacterium]|nr:sorbosone dehydrogenase family protein [Pseudomonadota bacterium]